MTGGVVDYAPYQESAAQFPHIPVEEFKRAVQLIEVDGSIKSGAHAVAGSLGHIPTARWLEWAYLNIPPAKSMADAAYKFVSLRRDFFYRLTVAVWGRDLRAPEFRLSRRMFLRGLALVYLIAFLSLASQLQGLIGTNGILPAGEFLDAVWARHGGDSISLLPTLAWINAGDGFLMALCYAGSGLALLLLAGIAPRVIAFLVWALYLSLFAVGQTFLSFQWDILLLESGFLAILFAPMSLNDGGAKPVSRPARWLLLLLLFKLMFQSGVVKLTSGDSSWYDLSALTYHYWTQPLPNPVSWFAAQLPHWFHRFSIILMFAIELVIPFLIFMPRRLRHAGAWILIAFQLLIVLTGNYTFFNILTICLCIPLFDDAALQNILPRASFSTAVRTIHSPPGKRHVLRKSIIPFITIVLVAIHVFHISSMFIDARKLPGPIRWLEESVRPLHVNNAYGLFRVMTKSRPEIIVEGSMDGNVWKEYEFRHKPGDVDRAPAWIAPHQPRLDWQMWFAALGDYSNNRWFVRFSVRLLEGSPAVLSLLESNPFPTSPPTYIRARLYEYRFTDSDEQARTGAWWKRELRGTYLPAIGLRKE